MTAGWLEQVAEQLDEYLRHGYAVVLVPPAPAIPRATEQRKALGAALKAIGHELPPEYASKGDADALEEFLRGPARALGRAMSATLAVRGGLVVAPERLA